MKLPGVSTARFARAVTVALFVSFLQTVVTPFVAPQLVLPQASATTSGIVTSGLALDINASNSTDMSTSNVTFGGSPAPSYTSSGGGYYTLNPANSNYISTKSPVAVGTNRYFSVFMWVYPMGAGQLLSHLGQPAINSSYHTAIIDYSSTDQMFFGLWNGSDQTAVNSANGITTPKNNWYYVGLVYDGTKLNAYINGELSRTSANFTFDYPADSYFGIGAYDVTTINQAASYGNMRFGGLSVYTTALTASQVSQNYLATQDRFAPTVTSPSNQSTIINRTATFTSSTCSGITSGATACTYQWQLSTDDGNTFTDISGATGTTYTTSILTTAQNGNKYRLKVTDPGTGTTTASDLFSYSGIASLSVSDPGSETDTALLFNGSNQYADVADTTGSPYDITGTFTLEAWVNPSNTCAGSGVVVSKRSYMLYCQSYVWRVMILADGVSGSGVATSVPVEPNEWHHIAITKNSSSGNVLFYYDGVLVETVNVTTTTMTPNNSPFEIGRYSVLGYYFAGEIDEVRLYNTQRTVSQIQGDMSSYATITDAALLAYYDMNEASGTTLFNRESGASSITDLTLQNAPTRTDVKTVDTTTLAAYTILKFDRTYITSLGGWKAPSSVTQASVLTVAGGGGGGARHAGGGGAGGVAYAAALPISAGSTYQISIGIGGLGYGQPGNNPFTGTNGASVNINDTGVGTNGGNSVFRVLGSIDSITAIGGGGSQTAGGSSGGTNSGTTYSTVPAATQYSTSYFVGYGNPGGQGYNGNACGTDWCGGGGGGAGGPGGIPSLEVGNTYPGDGGVGIRFSISGVATYYAGGGGGGSKDTTGASNGGNGGGGAGGVAAQGSHATENTGGGGGGGGFNGSTSYRGGNGGSGIIIIRWITATKPIFTQPTNDTTTAGLTDTITVSANPLNPLTRNYRWQVSTDTGTTWINASNGSGFTSNVYTTPVLETNTSGSRYQYRVIVTDSDTAGLFIVDTSVAVFIVVNPRITYTGSYTIQKYGSTHQDTFTVLNGTGNKTFTYSPNNRAGITWSSPVANTAVLTIGSTLFVGTYYETITATDTKGAQTSLGIAIVVSKADTITVTAIARTETYTGSTLTFAPSFTISGLKNSDTVTAAAMSWNYNGVENSGTLYSIQSTRPANAGTYTMTPVAPSSLTDSYTAVSVVPATLTVNRATRSLTLSNIVSPLKFGSFTTFTATPSAGVGDGSITYSTPNSESCTISAPSIRAIKSSGTCFATAVISQGFNFETATSNTVSTTLAKADTLTVTVDTLTSTTYTGSQYGFTPTVTVTGLKNSNTVGANPVNFQYASIVTPQSFTSTKPTDADTYTVRASALTLSTGSLSDYVGVTYVDGSLRINRAQQSQLFLAEYGATVGNPYRVIVFGGSGTGATSVTANSGTATGCSISGDTLTTTSIGTCLVTAVKAQDKNYETATVTISVYFLEYVVQQPAPTTSSSSGPGIALTGLTSVTLDPYQAPSISSISISSGRVGDTVTITGLGFTASALQSVKFWRNIIASIQGTPTNTQIVVLVPAGALSGKIAVITANGTAITEGSFTVLP